MSKIGKMKAVSIWHREIYDKNGNLKEKRVDRNIIPTAGLNALLDKMFGADTQVTQWYIMPFESDTTPSSATTYATPVFTESTAYDELVRQNFTPAAAAAGVITSTAAKATFTWSATKTIYGGALVSDDTKGDTAATDAILFCAAKFTTPDPVEDDDVSKIWLEITAENA